MEERLGPVVVRVVVAPMTDIDRARRIISATRGSELAMVAMLGPAGADVDDGDLAPDREGLIRPGTTHFSSVSSIDC